jgi:hypothetical protein
MSVQKDYSSAVPYRAPPRRGRVDALFGPRWRSYNIKIATPSVASPTITVAANTHSMRSMRAI